ncbi:major facilitator superfamily domain-containing protein 6-like [Apostichopus japonicus]|uniref:major facilitator superfamily domain-containing protein 6-like n=1 Tax=Stichopus japonicus TaxID=307972 RepID=UPI003AB3B3EA
MADLPEKKTDAENNDREKTIPFCPPKISRAFLPVKATYLCYIGALVTLFPVLPVYLRYLGLSPSQIGLIRGVEPFLDFLVSPVWGSVADKFSIHKQMVLMNVCGVGGTYFSTIFVPGSGEYNETATDGDGVLDGAGSPENQWQRTRLTFSLSLVLIATGQMFNAGVTPLMDANTQEMTKLHPGSTYGRQRLWGSIGGMVFSVSAGALMDLYAHNPFFLHEYTPAYVIFAILIILTLIPVWNIDFAPHKPPETFFRNIAQVFRNPRVVAFFLVMFTYGFSYGQDTFKYLFLDELGSPHILRSLCPAANCAAELFFLYNSKYIIRKIGHENAFLLVIAAYAVRFLAYSFLWDPWWILPVELLHGICFGILWPAVTSFCNSVAPPGMAATMQTMAFAVTAGLSEGTGTILGGLFYEQYGARNLFRAMAGTCVAVFIIYRTFLCFYPPIKPGSDVINDEEKKPYVVNDDEQDKNAYALDNKHPAVQDNE